MAQSSLQTSARSPVGSINARQAAQHPPCHARPAGTAVIAGLRSQAGPDAEHLGGRGQGSCVRQLLLQLGALRPLALLLHDRPGQPQNRRLRQRIRIPSLDPDLRALSQARGLPHLPLRQDAFRRRRPAARLRGSGHHRYVSGRLRLDADLGRPQESPLVVPQHAVGDGGRRLRPYSRNRFRRGGRLARVALAVGSRARARTSGPS